MNRFPKYLIALMAMLFVTTAFAQDKANLQKQIEILQAYAAVVQKNSLNGTTVIDASLLPYTKDEIRNAAMTLNSLAEDPAEKKSFVELAQLLAFFQPNVGNSPIPLSATSPGGSTWRSIVEAEMQGTQ